MKNELSGQTFEKYSNIKENENLSIENELFHADGRADRQTDMTMLFN